jgi:cytochrome c-type biogenesis protein CcmH/NrfF
VELNTLLLWSAAPVVLLIGIGALVVMARRRKSVNMTEAALSGDEQRRLASMIKPGE